MKIGYYLDFTNYKAGGVYVYAMGILNALLNDPKVTAIHLIYNRDQHNDISELLSHPKITPHPYNRKSKWKKLRLFISHFLLSTHYLYQKDLQKHFPRRRFRFIRRWALLFNPLRKMAKGIDVDLWHVPFQISFLFGLKKPLVITVHDVLELHYPQLFDSRERMRRAVYFTAAIEEADHILVWFDHVKKDLLEMFARKPEQVSACMPDVYSQNLLPESQIDYSEIKTLYGISHPYIYYPAACWPHKNHKTLIAALREINTEEIRLQLICTGHKDAHYENILAGLSEAEQKWILFPGIVDRTHVTAFYQNCFAVVIPSMYEGGGIPIIEAIKSETALLCSDIFPFRQTFQNTDFMFKPEDANDISAKIMMLIENADFLAKNKAFVKERKAFFQEYDFSTPIIEAYQAAIIAYTK